MATTHATRQAFGQAERMCEVARRFLISRATGGGGEGFSVRWFSANEATCADCQTILAARSPFALPAPEITQTAPLLKNPLGQQIRADMRRRYGPSIEDPEWATESYR